MVRSRFGEICSCCCIPALPGPAWVLLNYVLHAILCTSVHFDLRLPIRFPKNDIALVRLQHRMDLKKGDRRVCLPSNALDRNNKT